MPRINGVDKKKALLIHKEKLIQELKYYDKRIEEAKINETNNLVYDGSSDSDSDLSVPLDIGPSVTELKIQQSALQTCLNATQELTGLQVLQSEVNVLVEDPVFEGESPVTEDGIWREVTAECRVDLVPFSMMFYVHQPNRRFGPLSYRCLQVAAVKKAHANELNKSILPDLTTPSDAFEVFKSYAAAHRSRRTTLARLAEKYGESLFMMPLVDGGYQLKCASSLEISWMLQNKTSSIAPFHHQMKFDLEYMDESYIKTVTQAHKQLSNPSLETDDRTLLLSKIISTCLEAKGINYSVQESTESESETMRIKKRRTSLDQDPEMSVPKKKKEDHEIMAPPKSLPKKPRGKENNAENRNVDKTVQKPNNGIANDNSNKGKKPKNSEKEIVSTNANKENKEEKTSKVSYNKHKDITNKESNIKNTNIHKSSNPEAAKGNKKDELRAAAKTTLSKDKDKEKPENAGDGTNKKLEKGKKIVSDKKNIPHKTSDINENSEKSKPIHAHNNVADTKNAKTAKETKDIEIKQKHEKGNKKLIDNVRGTDKNIETVATDNKSKPIKDNFHSKTKENDNKQVNNNKTKVSKDVVGIKHKSNKVNNFETNKQHKATGNTKGDPKLSQNPQNRRSITKSINNRFLNAPKIDKRNAVNLQKLSKIPQKNSLSAEKIMKSNPLRISPRKSFSKFNTMSSQESVRSTQSSMKKASTNIPRLVKKPVTKTKS